MTKSTQFNHQVARMFDDYAQLLQLQGANHYRINAYRRASEQLRSLQRDVRDVLRQDGIDGLIALPTIGRSLAAAIAEIVHTGHWSALNRLQGSADPELLFQSIPSIGPKLAKIIHDNLHIDTLEALEIAAHGNQLTDVPGIGPRRAAAIRSSLAALHIGARTSRRKPDKLPSVQVLLDVDREYREKAAAKSLPLIAPKRFNPTGKAWLPVLHTHRANWHFIALFSNSERANALKRTKDWVVLFFEDDDHTEGQCTVVTETHGERKGLRTVRGRESEHSSKPQTAVA